MIIIFVSFSLSQGLLVEPRRGVDDGEALRRGAARLPACDAAQLGVLEGVRPLGTMRAFLGRFEGRRGGVLQGPDAEQREGSDASG